EFRAALDAIFKDDLAQGASVSAGNVRGGSDAYAASNVLDGSQGTYWASDDGVRTGSVELSFAVPVTFDVIQLQEPIALGQRVSAYHVDAWRDGAWRTVSRGTTIGYMKLDRTDPITTERLRLIIDDARAEPLISKLGLYLDPRAK
ncbi:MAG TPA: discoidin domain-containing protein, partial [Rhodothermales bacterium]|nr:discoidin domain-containing protein [Rhodothermales bacterium]